MPWQYPVSSSGSREQAFATAIGVISERGTPEQYNSNPIISTSQLATGALIGLLQGDSVTGIVLRNGVAATGAGLPTTVRAGIADSTGKMLAVTGNLKATANWPTGPCRLAFASPYVATAKGGYYACFVIDGSFTGDPMFLRRNITTAGLGPGWTADTGAVIPTFQWAAQTDLPAVGASLTLTAPDTTLGLYMGFYGTPVA